MEASWAKVMEVANRLREARIYALMKDVEGIKKIYPKDSGLNPHDDAQVAVDIFLQLTDIDFDAYIMTASGYKVKLYRCTPDDILAADHIQEQAGKRYAINADEKEEAIVKEIDEAMLELEQQWRRGSGSLKYDRWSEELAFGLKSALNAADAARYF